MDSHETESILDALPAPILVFTDSSIHFANQSAAALTGYTIEQLRQMTLDDLLHSNYVLKTASGLPIPVEVSINSIDWAGQAARIVTLTDLTTRNKFDQLHATANLYRMFTQNLPDIAIFFFDKDLRFQVVEGRSFEENGMNREIFQGKRLRDIFPPEIYERDEPALLAALNGQNTSQEVSYQQSIFMVHTVPLRDEAGVIFGGMVISQDITARKKAEIEQREQEALRIALQKERELNQLKTSMMVRISHEFRTPLTIILTSGEMIAHYGDRMSPERRAEHHQKLVDQVNHLSRALDDIALVVRGTTHQADQPTQPFDMVALCQDIAATDPARITLHTKEDKLFVRGNPQQIHDVIMHLAANALTYSAIDSPVIMTLESQDGDALLRLQDSGIGIPAEELGRIFEPFFRGSNTEERRGLGLGLPIVKDIVELHRGKIEVESTLGKGTTVTIRLPKILGV
ncbi:MAG: PAS domain-containing protein [Anaerolineae bacterium]|nr:PAS domain-containing protein [Anaerolineae bacterium]